MKIPLTTVGAFEAKNKFSELLERVHRGAEITITRHERAVAKLVPVEGELFAARAKATAELRALSQRYSLKGFSARELIEEGRA